MIQETFSVFCNTTDTLIKELQQISYDAHHLTVYDFIFLKVKIEKNLLWHSKSKTLPAVMLLSSCAFLTKTAKFS